MVTEIERIDLHKVDPVTMRSLRAANFGNEGWLYGAMSRIINGDGEIFPKATALIARQDGIFLGWSMVRHHADGGKDDYMTYVHERFRYRGVARSLLVVAFHNFGKVETYPWDRGSRAFYEKNKRFCIRTDTSKLNLSGYRDREIV